MTQHIKFLGMLAALSILVGCSSAGSSSGGGGSSPAPTATLSASPSSFTVGHGAATLTFTSTNATQGSIDQGEGPVGTNGSVQVTPSTIGPTIYTFTATGPGGTATASATVTVTQRGPAPTVSLTAVPGAVIAGQAINLTWTSNGATSVVIDNNVNNVQPVAQGTVTVATPPSTTQTAPYTLTYTATATGNYQQTQATASITVDPLTSFDGMPQDSSNVGQTDIDPNGAIGTKQYMEYVNTEYQAYDKVTHLPIWSTPQQIGTPWTAPLNTPGNVALPSCDGAPDGTGSPSGIQLDTVVNFDRLASRWVIAAKATFAKHYFFCIAVSNTDDLAASSLGWNAYFYTLDIGPSGNYYFPDWPKLGTWTDSYWATVDLQDRSNSYAEVGVAICAFDRVSMLSGAVQLTTPGSPLCLTYDSSTILDPTSFTYLGHSLIPADFEGTTPPPSGRDEFMVSIENPTVSLGANGTSNTINLWDFQPVDWSSSSPSLNLNLTTPTVATYTPGCYYYSGTSPVQTNCVPEETAGGIGQHIDSVGDRLMPRLSYRNFGTYESFLVSHTVQTNATAQNPLQTGVRWYELRDNGSGTPAIYQYGLISPDNTFFRFLPSIAQDQKGNAAVGYSVSNGFSDPAIDFSFWNLGTPNALAPELSIINGAGEEVTPSPGYGQWGSYSSMTVDPVDDCTFWYVNEYWPNDTAWSTRIAYFQVPGCSQ